MNTIQCATCKWGRNKPGRPCRNKFKDCLQTYHRKVESVEVDGEVFINNTHMTYTLWEPNIEYTFLTKEEMTI